MGGTGGAGGSIMDLWYDTSRTDDTSYLPMGQFPYEKTSFSWQSGAFSADVEMYVPKAGGAPLAVMLPGFAITADRYFWLGSVLASHGVAVAIVNRKGQFAFSTHTEATLTELANRNADPASPYYMALDLSRIVLAGHSQGAAVQAGLTDVSTCPGGFCPAGAKTPDGIRGLVLMGFHAEDPANPNNKNPLPAIEAPWLDLAGEMDMLANHNEVTTTFERLTDRPIHHVEIVGMNHFQFTDYVNPKTDIALPNDGIPTLSNKEARAKAATYIVQFVKKYILGDPAILNDLGASKDATVKGSSKQATLEDKPGHGLPRLATEPFGLSGLDGGSDNVDIVAHETFGGATYLLVRNDAKGAEIWRIAGGTLEKVPFPNGATNGIYGNPNINNILGAMATYKGKLWVGFSSGIQGPNRGSSGAEIWTYDGILWTPIVSNQADVDPEVTVTALAGCAANDGNTTATLTISGITMTSGEWVGGVIDDLDTNVAAPHILQVVANDAMTITVQVNETANMAEDTLCDGIVPGTKLHLRKGMDENGFGEPWNKAINAMAVMGDKLYVSTALNLDTGAAVYATSDGATFSVAVPKSFFGKHPNNGPISSSIPTLTVSSLGGTERLYFGAAGTQNYGARLGAIALDGTYQFVIDNSVDADNMGLDEAGMGHGNDYVTSIVEHNGRLYLSTFNVNGLEILSTNNPIDPFSFSVDIGVGATTGPGFGSVDQITGYLAEAGGRLWIGSVAFANSAVELNDKSAMAFRTNDGKNWQLASAHGFGYNGVTISHIFENGGTMYGVVGGGSLNTKTAYRPVRLYTVRDEAN
jgi:pimeloyl-ACP methyl ester carboxylesterase